jgi:hypothetical protein
MSTKSINAAKAVAAFVVLSVILYFYGDYWLGILTARPDFQLSANPSLVQLSRIGSFNTTTITFRSINGFESDLVIDAEPAFGVLGVKFTFEPSELHLPANGEVTCTLGVEVTSYMPQGQYLVDVSGVSGNLTRTIHVTLEILH